MVSRQFSDLIYLGSDHGGFSAKEAIKKCLAEQDYKFEDLGAHTLDPKDDYPDYGYAVAKKVAENLEENRGILLCRSGIGMDIVANKVSGIRSAQIFNEEMARESREKNDTNVLSVATDYLAPEEIEKIVKTWLETPFSKDERHVRRLEKIKKIEELDK